jgi:HPr kinase/phosphorylase
MGAASGTFHGSAVARGGAGILLLGGPGSGKSDLALRLIQIGFVLVADDRVCIAGRRASAPELLRGMLEVRGLGLLRFAFEEAELALVVRLVGDVRDVPRLPLPELMPDLGLPVISIVPSAASAAWRVALALDCLQGRVTMDVGAFA